MKLEHIYRQPQFGEEWFDYQNFYTSIVSKFPTGSKFVEIGSWKGKSAAYMAVEIANSGKNIEFICVDTFLGSEDHKNISDLPKLYEIFKRNMGPLEQYYKEMRMTSLEAATKFEDESLDFVFIDAGHTYEDVKNDIIAWAPKVKHGGILSGHDYSSPWPGVVRAVNELFPYKFRVTGACWYTEF